MLPAREITLRTPKSAHGTSNELAFTSFVKKCFLPGVFNGHSKAPEKYFKILQEIIDHSTEAHCMPIDSKATM
ncbi:hypothetical protein ACFSHR_24345 [Azotobacter chroococcum]